MWLVPDAELDDGLLDVVLTERPARRSRTCAGSTKVFKGTHVDEPGFELLRGREITFQRRPAVHRLRRRRPDRRAARHRARAARRAAGDRPVRLQAGLLAARATGAVTRLAGRGGTSLPGKVLMRAEPHAIARLAARLPRGQRRRLGHQRQDHDGGDGRRDPRPHRHAARPQPRRREHGRRRRRRAGRRARRRHGAVRGRRVLARAGRRRARAARGAARQPVPRPARPLRRAGDHRRPLGGDRRRPAADDRARAQRRRPAGRRPRPRPRGALLRRPGRRAGAARAPARVRLQALPPLRPRLRVRGRLPRPPRPLRVPATAAPAGPIPQVRASAVELRGIRSAAFTLTAPEGERRIELPLPGLYNVYNALGAAALCLRLGVPLDDVAAGLAAVEPAFGRAETIELGGRPTSILLVKNPAGANEVLRTLALEGARARPASACSTTAPPTAATSRGCGTPTGRSSPRTCAGSRARARAPPSWRCGSSTRASTRRGSRSSTTSSAALDRALAAGDGPLYALPTYTALLELQGPARPPRPRRGVLAVNAKVIWHDVECGALHRRPAAVARARARGGRAGARRRRRHRPRRARPRARRARGHRARPRPRAARRAAPSGPPGCRCDTLVADAAGFDAGEAAFALVAVPMQTIQLLPDAARAASSPPRGARSRPAASSRSRSPRELETVRATRELPPPDIGEADGWRYVSQPTAVRAVPTAARGSSACATRSRPAGERTHRAEDVDRARRRSPPTSSTREGAAAGLRAAAGARHRARPTTTSAPRWCCCVADRTLRVVRAVSRPAQHLRRPRQPAAARAPLRVARHRLRAAPASASASALDPDAHDLLLHRRRAGPRPGAVRARHGRDQARRAARGRRRAAPSCSRSAAATSCSATATTMGDERLPGRRPRRPRDGARGRPAADRQRGDRARRRAGAGRVREPRRPHAARAGRDAARPRAARPRQRRPLRLRGRARRPARHRGGHLSPRSAASQERPLRRLADRHRARDRPVELAPLDDALEAAAHAAARRAAGRRASDR